MDTKIFKTQSLTSRSPQLSKENILLTGNYAECVKCQRGGIQKNNRISEDREALLVGWSGKASWKK